MTDSEEMLIEFCAGERIGEFFDVRNAIREMMGERESLLAVAEGIVQWAEAYPIDVFPEPDFKKAAKVLKDNGMTLDAISASNMRHVITEVKGMALAALPEHLRAGER